jgi:protein SCO1/2
VHWRHHVIACRTHPPAYAALVSLTIALLLTAKPASALPGNQAEMSSGVAVGAPVPAALAQVGIDEHLGARLPLDLTFRDHTGTSVRLDRYFERGRPIIVNLMYHRCPMLCSVVVDGLLGGLTQIAWSVGREFDVLTISIDPRDAPDVADRKRRQVLGRYGRDDAQRGWHFLVGEEAAIARLSDALGFTYRWDADQKQYAHPAAIFVVTPEGKIARYLYGVEFTPADLRFGLLEASEGRFVSTLERVLLFCYHYDATGRRYSIAIARVLRIGGILLLLGVGTALTFLWRNERRDAAAKRG